MAILNGMTSSLFDSNLCRGSALYAEASSPSTSKLPCMSAISTEFSSVSLDTVQDLCNEKFEFKRTALFVAFGPSSGKFISQIIRRDRAPISRIAASQWRWVMFRR
jgi:hypothetical protein